MADNSAFKIRPMLAGDLDQALGLSLAEGWNQTERDWRFLFKNPDNICLVAEKNNRVAGTATALNYSDRVAWIGMVIVDKTLRGHGAGKMLLSHIIEKLRHVESIKLDATEAGKPLYEKLGFTAEYRIFRMSADTVKKIPDEISLRQLSSVTEKSFSEVARMDNTVFGADRTNLLRYLLDNYPDKAFSFIRNNKPEGYAFGRDGSRFNYLGPLNALSPDYARALAIMALKSVKNKPAAADILEDKEDMIAWLESIGFVKQRHFVRMHLKRNPYPGKTGNQYLISGPEFG